MAQNALQKALDRVNREMSEVAEGMIRIGNRYGMGHFDLLVETAREMVNDPDAPKHRSSAAKGGKRSGTKRPVSAAIAASRRLQGEYMGLLRHCTPSQRMKMKRLQAERGREAAVAEMRKLQQAR